METEVLLDSAKELRLLYGDRNISKGFQKVADLPTEPGVEAGADVLLSQLAGFHQEALKGRPVIGDPHVAVFTVEKLNPEKINAFFEAVRRLNAEIRDKRSPFASSPENIARAISHEEQHLAPIGIKEIWYFNLSLVLKSSKELGFNRAGYPVEIISYERGFEISHASIEHTLPLTLDLRVCLAPDEPSLSDIQRALLLIPYAFKSPRDKRLGEEAVVKANRKFQELTGKTFEEILEMVRPPMDIVSVDFSSAGGDMDRGKDKNIISFHSNCKTTSDARIR